ncbi:alpha-galactosidase [Clostridium saudiense]|uniref:alpha-galactosidase n=1 Tax=Clostridium saudiense TaxID=1414720 RepID=UPI00266F77FC|nr:alpha-galactosidase [Clostridium saudiense]
MPIIFHNESNTFHIYNSHISYIFKILRNGHLGNIYYGKKIKDRIDFDHLLDFYPRMMNIWQYDGDKTFSLEHIRQEYPSYGTGDMRLPAIEILQENGSRISDFKYLNHKITKGKPILNGLPATYVEDDDEATTLEVTLYDDVIDCKLNLIYTIYEEYPVITRSTNLHNGYKNKIDINQIMSMSIDMPDSNYEMCELTGAWARERYIKFRSLEHGASSIYSLRGHSSHNYNPFIALKRKDTTEFNGEIIGFSLVYSGNFLAQVDVDTYDVSRVMLGINPQNFNWKLDLNESFQTPEVVIVYSDNGINRMSQVYHDIYRSRLARGIWRDKIRPILINNWEATYFDFDEDKLLQIAKKAKEVGIELFVLDDGWFGKRNSSKSSLGDWYDNKDKLPSGIIGLSRKIKDIGLKFGLWFEPEMVNMDSEFYRKNPDYILKTPNRPTSQGRNQYVLDFSNPKVIDEIEKQIEKILNDAEVYYIKWDMNRSLSEVYSIISDFDEQGTIYHKYILGVYNLYDRLTKKFPNILFESCASGGGRFDPGMLYYAPQGWVSDNTDAIERSKIQFGTSVVYPLSSMGTHVSDIPNHQMMRSTPLNTRANVAYFGTFGYELDILSLSNDEIEQIKEQIKFMKEYRDLIQFGDFYRLLSPFEGNYVSWIVISKDKKIAIVFYMAILNEINSSYKKLKVKGLNPDYLYRIDKSDTFSYGDELMTIGLNITDNFYADSQENSGDFKSRIYILKAES